MEDTDREIFILDEYNIVCDDEVLIFFNS